MFVLVITIDYLPDIKTPYKYVYHTAKNGVENIYRIYTIDRKIIFQYYSNFRLLQIIICVLFQKNNIEQKVT